MFIVFFSAQRWDVVMQLVPSDLDQGSTMERYNNAILHLRVYIIPFYK